MSSGSGSGRSKGYGVPGNPSPWLLLLLITRTSSFSKAGLEHEDISALWDSVGKQGAASVSGDELEHENFSCVCGLFLVVVVMGKATRVSVGLGVRSSARTVVWTRSIANGEARPCVEAERRAFWEDGKEGCFADAVVGIPS